MMLFSEPSESRTYRLAGPEPDSLLGFLAILGTLRAIESTTRDWYPKACWEGAPSTAYLTLQTETSQEEIAKVVHRGLVEIANSCSLPEEIKDVGFEVNAFRGLLQTAAFRGDPIRTGFLSAIAAEVKKPKRDEDYLVSPYVFMFGQGHQHFIERFIQVMRDDIVDYKGPEWIHAALFEPWLRRDKAPGFRWDPSEDQRYALRFKNPSKEGAAPTVHGANRLAAAGLLSVTAMPRLGSAAFLGVRRGRRGWRFIWPIWGEPLSLSGVEALLQHPAMFSGAPEQLHALGVVEIMEAERVKNGKFMNVARARPRAIRL